MVEDKNSLELKDMHLKDLPAFAIGKITGGKAADNEMVTGQTGKYEVNLVPAVKLQMIKMQRTRNLVLFICIVISIVCGSMVAILGSISVGQQVAMGIHDQHLKKLSNTVLGYSELPEFLTIQNQVNMMTKIEDNKKVLSRIFSILATMLPNKDDTVKISELNIDLTESRISFDAQANAGKEPDYDYRVLEAFKKQVSLMTYDYGRYVDADGLEIPTRCIQETDEDGNLLYDKGSIYVIWKRGETGCDPGREDYVQDEDGNIIQENYTLSGNSNSSLDNTNYTGSNTGFGSISGGDDEELDEDDEDEEDEDDIVIAPGTTVLDIVPSEKIYRTPQFNTWYAGDRVATSEDGIDDDVDNVAAEMTKVDGIIRNVKSYIYNPVMELKEVEEDGKKINKAEISDVPHFESECIDYIGEKQSDGTVKWSTDNQCTMVSEDMIISDSANGLNSDNDLVLSFTTSIYFDHAVFAYKNKHMMVISPNKMNVTDSYVQVEDMFAAPASECGYGDSRCNDKENSGE